MNVYHKSKNVLPLLMIIINRNVLQIVKDIQLIWIVIPAKNAHISLIVDVSYVSRLNV